jgi:hypothetical protein
MASVPSLGLVVPALAPPPPPLNEGVMATMAVADDVMLKKLRRVCMRFSLFINLWLVTMIRETLLRHRFRHMGLRSVHANPEISRADDRDDTAKTSGKK